MTGLRHVPGQIAVFGTSSLQTIFDETYLSAFGEPLVSHGYELNAGAHYLELFAANRGEELRFLEYLRSQSGVLAASMNYIGFSLGERFIEDDPPELSYQPGMGVERDLRCLLSVEGEAGVRVYEYDDLVAAVKKADPRHLIAVIDVQPEHCRQVIEMIAEGYERGKSHNPPHWAPSATVGLTSSIDQSTMTDLFGFSDRLLLLAKLAGPSHQVDTQVLAINMSVDFAQVIRGYAALSPADIESPDAVFSFPFFEKVLGTVIADLTSGETIDRQTGELRRTSPALFAAAGNRAKPGGSIRVRLGYPATRPETMAATFVANEAGNGQDSNPVDWVDIPATTGLKPCFAIDVTTMKPSLREGSSFASAWLTGYYAALAGGGSVGHLGLLSKVAWLMGWTDRRRLPSGRRRLPCFVSVVGEEQPGSRNQSDMDELIAELEQKFRADFCLHGSSAAIGEWLRLNQRRLADVSPWVHKDIGDVDLLYSGAIRKEDESTADNAVEDVKKFVREWFKNRLGRNWVRDRKRPIELHHYEGYVSAAERLRSVTPVNKLYITRGGVIDTWGGLEDLQRRQIRFFPLTHPDFWARNSLFSSGADSLGLNILQWIGVTALLQLVSRAIGVEGPVPDRASVAKVQEILARFEAGKERVGLFGLRGGDLRERLQRRFERVETLMGSCSRREITDPTLDVIVGRLRQLQESRGNSSPSS